jgi:hypothetical protein
MRLWSPVLLLLALPACAKEQDRRLEVCEALVPAFLAEGERADIIERKVAPGDSGMVLVEFVRHAPFLDGRSTILCSFADDAHGRRLGLVGVEEMGMGPLSPVKLQLFRREVGHALGLDLSPPPALEGQEGRLGPSASSAAAASSP